MWIIRRNTQWQGPLSQTLKSSISPKLNSFKSSSLMLPIRKSVLLLFEQKRYIYTQIQIISKKVLFLKLIYYLRCNSEFAHLMKMKKLMVTIPMFSWNRLTLTSVFGLCFESVHLIFKTQFVSIKFILYYPPLLCFPWYVLSYERTCWP